MPNTRRRRFSVQHDIANRNTQKSQNMGQSSRNEADSELKVMTQLNKEFNARHNRRNKVFPDSSKQLAIVTEYESSTSVLTVIQNSSSTSDKDVTASSSAIDLIFGRELFTDPSIETEPASPKQNVMQITISPKKNPDAKLKQNAKDTTSRREKHPHQHRVKIRSPKRAPSRAPPPAPEDRVIEDDRQTIGTNAIDWEQEVEEYIENVTNVASEVNRTSNHSIEDMCRICHGGDGLSPELGQMISACACRGTVGRIHVKCLERWLTESGKSRCELCGTRYATRRVHRYGVPRALIMWILSQNAKQLMVDSLGIMLMSPLAILAAWLSGRTLAGLMTQDSHVTPWPLASTFVLACMTLVCYYCWIVSAATRHALGWWIWYRSQYEVRLQFQNTDE